MSKISCRICGNIIEKNLQICPYCGWDRRQKYCRGCGNPIQKEWKLCPICGKKIEKEEVKEKVVKKEEVKVEAIKSRQEKSKITKKDKLLIILMVIGITLFISGAILIFFGY